MERLIPWMMAVMLAFAGMACDEEDNSKTASCEEYCEKFFECVVDAEFGGTLQMCIDNCEATQEIEEKRLCSVSVSCDEWLEC
ncbi:MAG: hypothetical protein GY847_19940 [Proteobacteria bacterium]|nr:hypothetical protein [Pseudomonadota bacterium]